MLKFLSAKNSAFSSCAEVSEQHRFTRFANNQKRFTRFQTHDVPQSARPNVVQRLMTPPRGAEPEKTSEQLTIQPESPVAQCHIEEMAHLYASTNVPVGILKKALPLRFAQLDSEADDVVVCRYQNGLESIRQKT